MAIRHRLPHPQGAVPHHPRIHMHSCIRVTRQRRAAVARGERIMTRGCNEADHPCDDGRAHCSEGRAQRGNGHPGPLFKTMRGIAYACTSTHGGTGMRSASPLPPHRAAPSDGRTSPDGTCATLASHLKVNARSQGAIPQKPELPSPIHTPAKPLPSDREIIETTPTPPPTPLPLPIKPNPTPAQLKSPK
jgi:hypothetical protein